MKFIASLKKKKIKSHTLFYSMIFKIFGSLFVLLLQGSKYIKNNLRWCESAEKFEAQFED